MTKTKAKPKAAAPQNGAKRKTGAHDVAKALEAARPAIERIYNEVWGHAEIGLREVKSKAVHIRELKDAGFTVTHNPAAGVPTAFVAEWTNGKGGPKVGFLTEYDALPGLGNEAVPKQQPRKDGVTSGHGCGHNMIGAALTGAAIAAKQAMQESGIAGTLRVYGCAAEETEGAKIYMARAGLFDDLDAALHWHPSPMAVVMNLKLTANSTMKLEWHGRTAHAGDEPWNGRSAQDAMELAAHALNMMREHLEPTARTHYVFEVSGTAPNIVPDYARMWLTARDADRKRLDKTIEWIRQIAEGAALATQTKATVNLYMSKYNLLPNRPLAERMQEHLERVGVPKWTDEEQAFARQCQKEFGVAEKGLATFIMPLPNELQMGGSSDVADVSWNTPTMGVSFPAWPLDISAHTWVVTACGGMSIGLKATLGAAHVLLLTALDLMTDAELRAAARADFNKRTEGRPFISALPPKIKKPMGLPEWLNDDGTVETMNDVAKAAAK
jgi:aminobenzoyl-glutamate utilization protein B